MNTSKSILIVALFFLQGCSDKNPHTGLYNALFINYDERLASLDQNLSTEKNDEYKLEKQYQIINQKVTEKGSTLHDYEEKNALLQMEHDTISSEIEEVVDIDEKSREKPIKVKKIIDKMNNVTIKSINK